MSDLPDYELHRTLSERPPLTPTSSTARPVGVWVAVASLIVAAGIAAYIAFGWRPRPAPSPTSSPAARPAEAPVSLGGNGDAIDLPPLDNTDGLVRTLVRALSENPTVAAWLTTNGLIRNFTIVVVNIADGATPAKQLNVLGPALTFRHFTVVERGGHPYVDPRSYDRYGAIADAVGSIDPAGAARLYATLKPRIEEASKDLGSPEPFDRTLERAMAALLETPTIDGSARLRPKGIGYAYEDERLEQLTGAQRQLLRMGPRNVRVIKARLREIGLALGIAPAQLPQ